MCNPMLILQIFKNHFAVLEKKSQVRIFLQETKIQEIAYWNCTDLQVDFFYMGFPGNSIGKESACYAGDPGSIPGLGRTPGEENGSIPVFLTGEFHGQRSLAVCSPQGCQESDKTE